MIAAAQIAIVLYFTALAIPWRAVRARLQSRLYRPAPLLPPHPDDGYQLDASAADAFAAIENAFEPDHWGDWQ